MTAEITPVVLVTGASRGLGRGIAIELARGGYSVAINYASNARAAQATAAECSQAAPSAAQQFLPVQADIAARAAREAMVEQVLAAMGRLDALVNNAGIAPRVRVDITEASEQSFEEVIRTNLQGPYFLTQHVVRHWLEHRSPPALPGGYRIVFITSISAHTASVNRGEYCIAKAGLAMASQLWATRLAGEGIQVYELRPGIMDTDMTRGVKVRYDRLIEAGRVPQRRWGTPEDVGRAVRSLIDGDFLFSTGTVIDVDGGFHLRVL